MKKINLRKILAICGLACALCIPISSNSAYAWENNADNPLGFTYDSYDDPRVSLDTYALKWKGDTNKTTTVRYKATSDSIYVKVNGVYLNDNTRNRKSYSKYALSTQAVYSKDSWDDKWVGADTSSYSTQYRIFSTNTEYLVYNYVYEYAKQYGKRRNVNLSGNSYSCARCALKFRPVVKCGSSDENKIVGVWSPDSVGDIRKHSDGTIGLSDYPNS